MGVICGLHAVRASLAVAADKAAALYIDSARRDRRMRALIAEAERHGVAIHTTPRRRIDEIAGGGVHQGVALVSQADAGYGERDLPTLLPALGAAPVVLALDRVTDPRNLGACLRVADATDVGLVLAPKAGAAPLNTAARKAASGAAECMPFARVANLARVLRWLQAQGLWITGADMAGQDLHQSDLSGPRVIVMGGEGRGLRRLTRECCDQLVCIPMRGAVESLNVSVAAGVVLYEALRQRRANAQATENMAT